MLMLDSGAFSVWKSGDVIDLKWYIQYCGDHPEIDHYVNLDVIPGTMKKKPTREEISQACNEGWKNYERMVGTLRQSKVIPVFHQGEDESWLYRYLKYGVKYIGVSPDNSESTSSRKLWLRKMSDLACWSGIKIHGFGLATQELMTAFPWYSVDSTTWLLHSTTWHILIPQKTGGQWDYRKNAIVVRMSPRSVSGLDFQSLTPTVKRLVLGYLGEHNIPLGKFSVDSVSQGYKALKGEYWLDKRKIAVVRTVHDGVSTSLDWRGVVNALFYKRSAKAAGIKRFYFSAVPESMARTQLLVKHALVSFSHLRDYSQWVKLS